ncbi:hypothetical protein EX30DRAFT_244000 [Ascodesmis nigricans]|uniref:Uncharacterized protein n=1 Tax=Ascodesmis nigricans TaxID=341454 RepID=A0A4S2MIE6_9PEZI|nr:hypothetical protein EX30DRAFT_244000 [Ascodesmis nigricans]
MNMVAGSAYTYRYMPTYLIHISSPRFPLNLPSPKPPGNDGSELMKLTAPSSIPPPSLTTTTCPHILPDKPNCPTLAQSPCWLLLVAASAVACLPVLHAFFFLSRSPRSKTSHRKKSHVTHIHCLFRGLAGETMLPNYAMNRYIRERTSEIVRVRTPR